MPAQCSYSSSHDSILFPIWIGNAKVEIDDVSLKKKIVQKSFKLLKYGKDFV